MGHENNSPQPDDGPDSSKAGAPHGHLGQAIERTSFHVDVSACIRAVGDSIKAVLIGAAALLLAWNAPQGTTELLRLLARLT